MTCPMCGSTIARHSKTYCSRRACRICERAKTARLRAAKKAAA